ncbi:MAG: trimethylamine methyltransferase family protein [Ignavibacteriales bacterium]|nr:trimethylamine methyltransferase family protein [Ignavibacteriales bacterium]
MKPKFEILSKEIIFRILDEAFQLLVKPGIKIKSAEARKLLKEAGAQINEREEIVSITRSLVEEVLKTVPHQFYLYDRFGNPAVNYGGDDVNFDPGSSGINILDPVTLEHKPAVTSDLIKLIKVAEQLPQYSAQSTAVICNDVPKEVGDFYRLYLVLLYSKKPVVTGAFTADTIKIMFDMLSIFSKSGNEIENKPQAVFDVCPTPPLMWNKISCSNLIDLARKGIPAEMVSMPLAGSASPVTLIASVVQHAAECLSGITIHQLAKPGSPIVWGGAPAIFDMRFGTTPMGAIETAMIGAAIAQVGKFLNLPTHTYLAASDAKIVDAQAGMESGISAMIGALAGINMISGAGMLDFLACQSAEKLVIDAEAISMAKRMLDGIQLRTETLALEMFEDFSFKSDFLKQKFTRQLFNKEQHIPSSIIDRSSLHEWEQKGKLDTFGRAKLRVVELVEKYQKPEILVDQENELINLVEGVFKKCGMEKLPKI